MTEVKKETIDVNEEIVLFEWEALERSYKKRDKDFWITAVSILVLVSVILIFIKEFFLIVALLSILFLYYVMATVPPAMIKHKITNWGIYFGEARYSWDTFEKFWFSKSLGSEMVNLGTVLRFPRSISMVIDEKDKEKIKELITKKITLVESSPTFIDKLVKWAGERLPLEDRIEMNKEKKA